MSTLDVVAEILREVAPRALCAKEIADLAGARLPSASKTPQTVISRDLAIDVRDHGAASRFLRVDRGEFVLKEALPMALFNDNDGYASQWTRNLIEADQIAKGVVDERSIRDLRAADVASYRQFHAFSGIGTWSRALRDAGWPDDVPVWSGSCPCTPWSQAGRKKGFDDEQHLWPEWFRLIKACRPPVIFAEQVASKDGLAWLDVVQSQLEGEGYTVRAIDLCAAGFGAAHLRQRLYIVAVAGERGCEVVRSARLHDRGQPGDDVARCGAADLRDASINAGARLENGEDLGEADGAIGGISIGGGCHCLGYAVELGDTSLAGGGRDAGALPRAEGAGEGEWIEPGNLADEPVTPGTTCWGGVVRGFWAFANWIYCRPAPGQIQGTWRSAEPILVKMADGTPPPMGPLCAGEVDATTSETNAVEVLRGLWPENGAQALQRALGRFGCLQAAEVLRSGLHGQWHGGKDQDFECSQLAAAERETGGQVLFPLRSFAHTSLRAPQGREPSQQRAFKSDDLVRLLSSSCAFAELRSDDRTAEALQVLLKDCQAEGLVRRASHKAQAVWESIADENKVRLLLGLGGFRRASISPLIPEGSVNNRAKRLRGYGNGIVLPQATEFIGAVMDAITDVEHAE